MREPVRRLTTDTSPQASSSDASQRRFLFVCTHLKTGGAERQWSILLPELHRQGFEVALLTLTALLALELLVNASRLLISRP